ncbi:type II secretion system minor pseudopilin GspI [Thalassotalea agarivorans]|uniref:Type II secretion system protein I n=1 Tax=Thalassotalea agarivorans TaxID=349064 RepID=A0A1I0E406_THASX|nr:type II secretion system minor pseudopilin GspI [Thalassotalea agarivorans]SET39829.1 general secretion pathway protein I [Thalassotalea agarivorans]
MKNSVKGFTLIEVLIAMAVFSIAGIAIVSATSNSARSLGFVEQKMIANWVASNQLTEIHLEQSWPPKNNKKGMVEIAGAEWFWVQKVVATTNNDMKAVTVEVRQNEDQELPLSSLMTYVSKEGS